jgi:ankyrin repeat protein
MLLEAKADPELTNYQGQTALYLAVANGNEGSTTLNRSVFLSHRILSLFFSPLSGRSQLL